MSPLVGAPTLPLDGVAGDTSDRFSAKVFLSDRLVLIYDLSMIVHVDTGYPQLHWHSVLVDGILL